MSAAESKHNGRWHSATRQNKNILNLCEVLVERISRQGFDNEEANNSAFLAFAPALPVRVFPAL